MTFTYTEGWNNIKSSLVKGIFHDAATKAMLIRLEGDNQYIYPNVSLSEAKQLAEAGSVGSAYNRFRRDRPRGTGARRANSEVVQPAEVVAPRRVQGNSNVYQPLGGTSSLSTGGNLTVRYEVSFSVNGAASHKTVVDAPNLIAAATDVAQKLEALSLNARIIGVVVKS